MYERLVNSFTGEEAQRLERNATKLASLWLTDISSPESMRNECFVLAVLLRIGFQRFDAVPGKVGCGCGFPKAPDTIYPRDIMFHQLGCKEHGRITTRHDKIKFWLADEMRKAGWEEVQPERPLPGTADRKGRLKRIDISAEKPGAENGMTAPAAIHQLVDITIINIESTSHKKHSFDKALKEKKGEKTATYGKWAADNGYELLTFGMSIYGEMDKQSMDFLKSVWSDRQFRDPTQDDDTEFKWRDFLRPLSRRLAYGNALCIRHGRRLREFGIDFSRCPWSRFSKKQQQSNTSDEQQQHQHQHQHHTDQAPLPINPALGQTEEDDSTTTADGDEPRNPTNTNRTPRDDATDAPSEAQNGPSQSNLQFPSEVVPSPSPSSGFQSSSEAMFSAPPSSTFPSSGAPPDAPSSAFDGDASRPSAVPRPPNQPQFLSGSSSSSTPSQGPDVAPGTAVSGAARRSSAAPRPSQNFNQQHQHQNGVQQTNVDGTHLSEAEMIDMVMSQVTMENEMYM